MGKKEFSFYGLKLEQVKALSPAEFMALLPARERRALKRGRTESQKKVLAHIAKNRKKIRTHDREMVITPNMLDVTIEVYSGKEFVKVLIEPDMLGHRLGEFAPTRRRVSHSSPGVGATRSSSAMSVR